MNDDNNNDNNDKNDNNRNNSNEPGQIIHCFLNLSMLLLRKS